MTRREAATRLISTGVAGCIREAQGIDPGHPLIQIALANLDDYQYQADFLREYGTNRLPNDAAFCRTAVEMLVKHDKPRARRALQKAKALAPDHPDLPALQKLVDGPSEK